MTPRLSAVRLKVRDPKALADFYVTHLGMQARAIADGWRVGFSGRDADLLLLPGGGEYQHDRNDRYWKIGITLPNVDMAYDQLAGAGLGISAPGQFLDIGYMCHLSDLEGFQIELLQHDFAENRPASAGDPALPLGGGARIGQITLRTGDINTSTKMFGELGMGLLSVQPVPDFNFNLHFLAFTRECPPVTNLRSVKNREWLWKRPYTLLEFQHFPGARIVRNDGYGGLEIEGLDIDKIDEFGDPILRA